MGRPKGSIKLGAVTRMPEYWVWRAMIRRCENKNADNYRYYGGRGVSVCARWRISFADFLTDMGNRPTPKHRIERRDNEGNYEPGNCRWVTHKEQCRNTRSNRRVAFGGQIKCLKEWAESLALPYKLLHDRIAAKGWPAERAFSEPKRRYTKNAEGK